MSAVLATVGGILGIAGAVSTLAQGLIGAQQRYYQLAENKKELETAKTNLENSYNLAVRNARQETQDRNAQIQTQIKQTAAMQEQAVKQASSSMAVQNELLAAQMAELQVEASQKEGSAIQAAAVTGFRGDTEGSLYAGVRETRRATDRALKQAGLQAQMTRMSSYYSAVNNYTSAENQKAQYAEQQRMNERALQRNLTAMEEEYKLKYKAITEAQETMNTDSYKWMYYFGMGADLMGSAANSGSQFIKAGQQAWGWGSSAAPAEA